MKRLLLLAALFVASGALNPVGATAAYNFGDYTSSTLAGKAWEALAKDDLEGVLAYTNKCIELYGETAKKMQASLTDYTQGEKDKIFANWALNDVATSFYIQGEAYLKADMKEEARAAYEKVVNEFTYGQAWDPKGWFWKPAEAAKEKLGMLESGKNYDFGDYSSSYLTNKAWGAFGQDDVEGVSTYVDKIVALYGGKAKEMQESLTEFPQQEPKENVFNYWALNDVGTALFIKAEALKKAGQAKEAQDAYRQLIDNYYYAQCWDPKGWFWKPAEAAQQAMDDLGKI